MPPRVRLLFSTLSLTLFVIAAVPFYRVLSQRGDIWWTPPGMLVPLAESTDRVEIYVRREPVAARSKLDTGGWGWMGGDRGSSALTVSDIGLRFNNWDRVRAEGIVFLLACAAVCGVTAFTLLLVLTGRLADRGEMAR